MPRIRVRGTLPAGDPANALRQVVDYERWPEASDAVRSVRVQPQGGGASTSLWEVEFGNGLMRWSENDRLDVAAGRATFDLIEGDPQVFTGSWRAERRGAGCVLTMEADFDLGMPSLGHTLDPMAIEAVEDAAGSVLRALFGDGVEIEYGSTAAVAATPNEEGAMR